VPGSGPGLVARAAEELRGAGAGMVEVVDVPEAAHMFDLPPVVGTSDLGVLWEGVKKALDFVVQRLWQTVET